MLYMGCRTVSDLVGECQNLMPPPPLLGRGVVPKERDSHAVPDSYLHLIWSAWPPRSGFGRQAVLVRLGASISIC